MKLWGKLKLMWFGITHVIEITDYLAERIDRAEHMAYTAVKQN